VGKVAPLIGTITKTFTKKLKTVDNHSISSTYSEYGLPKRAVRLPKRAVRLPKRAVEDRFFEVPLPNIDL
jgi:hypothetical protein